MTDPLAPAAERADLRYEIKMVAQRAAYPHVLHWLRLDPEGIRVLHPPRRVQSVYLDTVDQASLAENLAGISHREKLRFRWYGDEVRGVRGNLERKVRHNQLGWKDVGAVARDLDVEGCERRRFVREVVAGLRDADPLWRKLLDAGLGPAQWISYVREYFTTADGLVRITVDHDLEAFDQRFRRELSRRFRSALPDVTIVEAKCAAEAHDVARRVLRRFPLPIDKCSKFVLASCPSDAPGVAYVED